MVREPRHETPRLKPFLSDNRDDYKPVGGHDPFGDDPVGNREIYHVTIAGSASRRGFTFSVLEGGRIRVIPGNDPEHIAEASRDWRAALSIYEKVNVMNRILAIHRQFSRDKQNFKIASVGLTTTGNLYIAFNGAVTPSRYSRRCAEQKVNSFAEEIEATRGARGDLEYTEVYVEGGAPGIPIIAPCGECVDSLARRMKPDAPIYALPGSDGRQLIDIYDEQSRDEHGRSRPITVSDVPPGMAWATTIGHLNRERKIELPNEHKHHQTDGVELMKREISTWSLKKVEEDPNIVVRDRLPSDVKINPPKRPPANHREKIEAESKQHVPLNKLNEYMREQIYVTVANRLKALARDRGMGILGQMSKDEIDRMIEEELLWARCAVVQRDDGKLFAAVTIKTADEPASDTAENFGLGQHMRELGTQGVKNVWMMEVHPKEAKNGILRTSPKGPIERMLKRPSQVTGTVEWHFVPFNAGKLSAREVADIMIHRGSKALYPSGHTGREVGRGSKKQGVFENYLNLVTDQGVGGLPNH